MTPAEGRHDAAFVDMCAAARQMDAHKLDAQKASALAHLAVVVLVGPPEF